MKDNSEYTHMLTLRPIRRFFHAAAVLASTDVHACAVVASSETPGTLTNQIHNLKPLDKPALEKLKAERNPEKLFNLFKENAHNKLVIENRFAFEDTISRLAGAQRFDYIEQLLEHQKTLPQGRREGFIVRIIMLYGRAGMTENAVQTFYDMHLYGCRRTVKSFNAALTVLTQTCDLVAIEAFLNEVPEKFGIEVDIFSVNIVVKALCNMGILDKAYLFMVVMEKAGIRPDVFTYTTLISGFYKINRSEIGNGIWNLMVRKRCLPNLATFNVRIQYLVNCRRAWQANSVMALMQNIGVEPDEVTYNLVIKGFGQARYLEMAKRVYSALHGNGYKPNVKIFQTMIHYLLKGREYDLAYNMCKDCMNRNWFPNVDTIYTLLDGLKKSKQVDKAIFIMRLARRRVPPFSQKQLGHMQSILSDSGVKIIHQIHGSD